MSGAHRVGVQPARGSQARCVQASFSLLMEKWVPHVRLARFIRHLDLRPNAPLDWSRIMAGGDPAAPHPSAPALVRGQLHGRLGRCRRQIVTFQPGGFSGWHTHPGPVIFTVRTGTLTVYEGGDPTCTPHVFTAGTGTVEAATSNHIHMVRNETSSVAEALVTYMVPVGANPLRTDLPNPGNCPF